MPAYYGCMTTIYSTPERGPPLPTKAKHGDPVQDLTGRVAAASATVHKLAEHGMLIEPLTLKDRQTVSAVMTSYAEDPEATSRISTNSRIGTMTPAALRAIDASLKEFGQGVVESSTQLRHYVTNKLLEESDNPDPRIRVRALELLGKISDVGLFVDKTEVTITHQTTSDLKEALRAKLTRLVDVEDAEVLSVDVLDEVRPKLTKAGTPWKAKPPKPRTKSTEEVPAVDLSNAMSAWGDDDD